MKFKSGKGPVDVEETLKNFRAEKIQTIEWSQVDKIVLSKLRTIYKGNFCAMATILKSYTCLQVCHFCMTTNPTGSKLEEDSGNG